MNRQIIYWVSTGILVTECLVGGVMGALRLPPFIGVITHLGYPFVGRHFLPSTRMSILAPLNRHRGGDFGP